MHWAKTCPHKSNANSANIIETVAEDDERSLYDEEVNIILMTNNPY